MISLIRKLSLLVVFASLIAGCDSISEFTKGKDNAIPPTPLTDIQSSVTLSTRWSKGLGGGGNRHFINLKPILSDGVIYAANSKGTVIALDAASGQSRWQADTRSRLGGGPGVATDRWRSS